MKPNRLVVTFGTLALGSLLAAWGPGWAQPPAAQEVPPQPQAAEEQEQGTEVLARGPVHEAFAEPVNPRPQASSVLPKQPPDPIEELPPELLLGACLQVDGERFGGDRIRRLYESAEYPWARRAASR